MEVVLRQSRVSTSLRCTVREDGRRRRFFILGLSMAFFIQVALHRRRFQSGDANFKATRTPKGCGQVHCSLLRLCPLCLDACSSFRFSSFRGHSQPELSTLGQVAQHSPLLACTGTVVRAFLPRTSRNLDLLPFSTYRYCDRNFLPRGKETTNRRTRWSTLDHVLGCRDRSLGGRS